MNSKRVIAQGLDRSKNAGNYMIIPPPNFSYLEDSICRCCMPITRHNASFAISTGVSCIVNVSSKNLDAAFVDNCEEYGITVKSLLAGGEHPPLMDISRFDKWVAHCLEVIFVQSNENLTLLVGSSDNFYESLLVACFRRLQDWSYISILAEFRQNVWPHRMPDFEQMIERFDPKLVDCTASVPDSIVIHNNIKDEERKLLARSAAARRLELELAEASNPVPQSSTDTVTALAPIQSFAADDNSDASPSQSRKVPPSTKDPDNIPAAAVTVAAAAATHYQSSEFSPAAMERKLNYCSVESEDRTISESPVGNKSGTVLLTAQPGFSNKIDTIASGLPLPQPPDPIAEAQRRDDLTLLTLLFSPRNQLISDAVSFDPSLSLINEKDDED